MASPLKPPRTKHVSIAFFLPIYARNLPIAEAVSRVAAGMAPTGGGVASYSELAACWGGGRPLYGLQAVGLLDDREPLATVGAMAAHYLAAVRTVAPAGPFLLGGWSLGGTVAFEMAQQLRRQGEEVALLALLDAPAPAGSGAPAAIRGGGTNNADAPIDGDDGGPQMGMPIDASGGSGG